MINFIIQVQLHDASQDDIYLFNRKMRIAAFTPISASAVHNRITYECHHFNSISEVISRVLRVATQTGKKISFTVMKDKATRKQFQ